MTAACDSVLSWCRLSMLTQLRHVGEEKGWGVLAGEPLAAGSVIVQYTGEVVTKEVSARRNSMWGAPGESIGET